MRLCSKRFRNISGAGIRLDTFDDIVLTRYKLNPRFVPIADLAEMTEVVREGLKTEARIRTAPDPAAAWQLMQSDMVADDFVCITGSVFLVAEMRPLLVNRERQELNYRPASTLAPSRLRQNSKSRNVKAKYEIRLLDSGDRATRSRQFCFGFLFARSCNPKSWMMCSQKLNRAAS